MNSSSSSSLRTDYHVAQQTRRDKLRFDPPMFDFSVGSGDLHTALYKPDQFTTTLQSNPELLPYNSSSQLYQGHELAQMLLPVNQPPSLTLASNNIMTNTGPLGPFTGYATVIKGSRFLKPAQQLLEEFCIAVMGVNKGELLGIEELGECVFGVKDHVDGVSSSSLSSSTQAGNCGGNASKPEFEQKKAKLLYMQEEVCRRYKHYHQQMQMVVSSFESVPGLGSATPYTSLALKSISKHFRRLKTVISNQLKQISRMLGEEPTSSQSISRSANIGSNTRLPYMEHNHPVWRPQRGLPERAVSVLRAWLFEHFLHPYPTDADKHMLASQTGLSRNQVSNWFINARVRLWKPMVEEIHMLETTGKNSGLIPGNSIGTNKHSSKTGIAQASNIVDHNNPLVNCGSLEPVVRERITNQRLEVWRGERESRVQEEVMEENLISFGGYTDGKINQMGAGFGAVSLTLGLRHDGAHQQQQSRHFGVQMLHDFVG